MRSIYLFRLLIRNIHWKWRSAVKRFKNIVILKLLLCRIKNRIFIKAMPPLPLPFSTLEIMLRHFFSVELRKWCRKLLFLFVRNTFLAGYTVQCVYWIENITAGNSWIKLQCWIRLFGDMCNNVWNIAHFNVEAYSTERKTHARRSPHSHLSTFTFMFTFSSACSFLLIYIPLSHTHTDTWMWTRTMHPYSWISKFGSNSTMHWMLWN